MVFSYLYIDYSKANNIDDFVTIKYKLENHSIVEKWANCLNIALKKYSIDEPDRFYGFGTKTKQSNDALNRINNCIDTINSYSPIIDRRLTSIHDQDTLNYLHHIFEVYHGLLDKQQHEFWIEAPAHVKNALGLLNTSVHRCEYVFRFAEKKHILTWYKMPKILRITEDELDIFTQEIGHGTVCLLYTEIGKTIEDLAIDNDQYIFPNAFKPFDHYSADFAVFFGDHSKNDVDKIKKYYQQHEQFFLDLGYDWESLSKTIGFIPLAKTESIIDLNEIESRTFVRSVRLV